MQCAARFDCTVGCCVTVHARICLSASIRRMSDPQPVDNGAAVDSGDDRASFESESDECLTLLISAQHACLQRLLSRRDRVGASLLAASSGRVSRLSAALHQHSQTVQRTRQQLVDISRSLQSEQQPALHRCHQHITATFAPVTVTTTQCSACCVCVHSVGPGRCCILWRLLLVRATLRLCNGVGTDQTQLLDSWRVQRRSHRNTLHMCCVAVTVMRRATCHRTEWQAGRATPSYVDGCGGVLVLTVHHTALN